MTLTACNGTELLPTQEVEEGPIVTPESEPGIVSGEFRDALESLFFRVNDIALMLPMSFATLENKGFELDLDNEFSTQMLAPWESDVGWLLSGEQIFPVGFTNFDGVPRSFAESYMTQVATSILQLHGAKVELYFPGEITLGSTYDAVITAYGEPIERYNQDKWEWLSYSTEDASVWILIDTETNLVEDLFMAYWGDNRRALYEAAQH